MNIQKCYLCNCESHIQRPGIVRDNNGLKVLQCTNCDLVFLSSFDHISREHYSESGMHGGESVDVDNWIKDTAEDDERRFNFLKTKMTNRNVLDFGCGNGGFIERAKSIAKSTSGIEPELALVDSFKMRNLEVWRSHSGLVNLGTKWDLITAFHVVEHLPDPKIILQELSQLLESNGEIIIEVPNANDALLTLYNSTAFQKFSYWSQHLFLFSESTLRQLVKKAGLRLNWVQHIQRYTLSNHLYWLSNGKPGGHKTWNFLSTCHLDEMYEKQLASLGIADTIIAGIGVE